MRRPNKFAPKMSSPCAACSPSARRKPSIPICATGEVELKSRGLRLLNASQVPPFVIDDETDANENTRLKYRYLDLRRPQSLGHCYCATA